MRFSKLLSLLAAVLAFPVAYIVYFVGVSIVLPFLTKCGVVPDYVTAWNTSYAFESALSASIGVYWYTSIRTAPFSNKAAIERMFKLSKTELSIVLQNYLQHLSHEGRKMNVLSGEFWVTEERKNPHEDNVEARFIFRCKCNEVEPRTYLVFDFGHLIVSGAPRLRKESSDKHGCFYGDGTVLVYVDREGGEHRLEQRQEGLTAESIRVILTDAQIREMRKC